ncbi:unnamed protein product, partial [Lepidochelys kempii]
MDGSCREGGQGGAGCCHNLRSWRPGSRGGDPQGSLHSALTPPWRTSGGSRPSSWPSGGWGQFHQPRNLLLALVGEVGEVAELFQWRAEPAAGAGLPGWAPGERAALAEELSDVLLYLVSLAQQCRVDLPRAALRKLDRNRARYPAHRAHGSARKYTHYQDRPPDACGPPGL